MNARIHLVRALAPLLILGASGCGDDPISRVPSNVSARVNEGIATVVNVHWTTADASVGYVSYGTMPSLGQDTLFEPANTTNHSLALLGLLPDTTYYYRVITWDGADAGASDVATVHTGSLPSGLPKLTTTGDSTSEDGFTRLTLAPVVGDKTFVSVFDSNGNVVWYHAEDRAVSVTRAAFSRDGSMVLYNASAAAGAADSSEIVRVPLDGQVITSVSVPGLGQDFLELPDGTFAALVADQRTVGGKTVLGDQLVEVGGSGSSKPVFSTFDCFDPTTNPGDGTDGSWTGANALSFDAGSDATSSDDDSYYIGLRNLSTIVKVSRATGKCSLVVGSATPTDTTPTLAFASGTPAFRHQGQFNAKNTSLLVVNADGDASGSRLLGYTLDMTAGTATETPSYSPSPSLHVSALGAVTVLVGNDRFINWSTAGKLEVITTDGMPVWSLTATPSVTFGYHDLTDQGSLYIKPAAP